MTPELAELVGSAIAGGVLVGSLMVVVTLFYGRRSE